MTARDVWTFYEALGESAREDLLLRERGVAAICDLRQEVNSGGFENYFSYWGGDTAQDALRALPVFLGNEWALLLREAMGLLGQDYPTDPDDRQALIIERDLSGALSELDERFYALEAATDADALLSASLA